ncbi:hypothetical protein F3I62_19090 [Pseudomonas sp. R-28-1W-6]|uniref:hypothetical protein n=1 Tax=Pseudomonas sp. R-28-1W-6 TaxID=2650101 RepID=UPI001365D2D9|nr:hypothetical protein [Pseudomonas sp. R-28-1W-6]MWV14212.1 hypothetical protein [Pseudomonas sp. R-28-1W-6]
MKLQSIWVEKKWVSAIEAIYSRQYLERLIKANFKLGHCAVGDRDLASIINLVVDEESVKQHGFLFDEKVNLMMVERIQKIDHREASEVRDHYALMALCEAGVLHAGVIEELSPQARRIVLEADMGEGGKGLAAVERLRKTRDEFR